LEADHLRSMLEEAQTIVDAALSAPKLPRPTVGTGRLVGGSLHAGSGLGVVGWLGT